jgi:hypothetical protein
MLNWYDCASKPLKLGIKAFCKKVPSVTTYIHEQVSNNKWAFEVFRRTFFS